MIYFIGSVITIFLIGHQAVKIITELEAKLQAKERWKAEVLEELRRR